MCLHFTREFEQQRELNEKGFQVVSGHKNLYPADSRAASSEAIIGHEDKVCELGLEIFIYVCVPFFPSAFVN